MKKTRKQPNSGKLYALETYTCGDSCPELTFKHNYGSHKNAANHIKSLIGSYDYIGLVCFSNGGKILYRTIFEITSNLYYELELNKKLIHNLKFTHQAMSQYESGRPETVVYNDVRF